MKDLNGSPSIIIATAWEPNAGAFDPIAQLVELARIYNAWLHVDGAFGLFAKLSSNSEKYVSGVENAHSVTVDGHKWLNVPYDCGFAFLRETSLFGQVFTHSAEYLPSPTDREPVLGALGPEMSRRANEINLTIGDAVIKDGRIYMGMTKYGNKVAFRPAIVNWRTSHDDVKLIVDIVNEISSNLK